MQYQQNLGLPKGMCAFPMLSARLWPRCYRDCEKLLTDSRNKFRLPLLVFGEPENHVGYRVSTIYSGSTGHGCCVTHPNLLTHCQLWFRGSGYRVPTPPGKSWIFLCENSRTWKVLENHFGPGKSWKLKLKVLESSGKISLKVMHFSSGSNIENEQQ